MRVSDGHPLHKLSRNLREIFWLGLISSKIHSFIRRAMIAPGAKQANGEEIKHLHCAQHAEAVKQSEKTSSAGCNLFCIYIVNEKFSAEQSLPRKLTKLILSSFS